MQKLVLNTGIEEYEVEDHTGTVLGVLRVNTSDPNLYARFKDLYNELPALTEKYQELENDEKVELDEKGFPTEFGEALLSYKALDTEVKEKLAIVFPSDNDFDKLFDGMNILAGTDIGCVLENFLDMLAPLIETSVEKRSKKVEEKAKQAVAKATKNREQRRASAKQ